MERKPVNRTKRPTSIRLTDDAKYLLDQLAKRLGVTQAAVMEIAIREAAEKRGITLNGQQS